MKSTTQRARYRPVRGLARGMSVLWALKEFRAAAATAVQLSERSGLHRTTVKRLLETLRQCGFVSHNEGDGKYRFTFRIRQLSEGYRDETLISEVAEPFLQELTAKVRWPSDLVTLERGEIVVRSSTHSSSPLSFTDSVLGYHPGFLRSAVGRAYLAFCPLDEREALLKILRARKDAQAARARDRHYVDKLVEETQRQGYAKNAPGEEGGSRRFGAIAVPIRTESGVLACLNIIFLSRAITMEQIVARHLKDLQAAARKIEEAYASVDRRPLLRE